MSLRTLFSSRTGKFLLVFIPLIIIIITAVFFLFNKKGIKREHLVTVALVPDSTKSQEAGFSDEIKINLPAGTIKQPDSLKIYRVSNTTGPHDNTEEMNVFDLEMLIQNNFNNDVNIQIPYDKSKLDPSEKAIKQVLAMYFNTEKNIWEPVDAILNEEKGVVTISVNHFSRFAIFKNEIIKKEPGMKLNDFVCIPENLNQLPSLEISNNILSTYSDLKQYNKECLTTAYGAISDYYGFTSAFTTLAEKVGGYEWGKQFNELTGNLGLYLTLGQYVIDVMNGQEYKGRANLWKNLTIYALGEYMGMATQIAFVGVFFIDYSLNKYGEAVYETEYANIERDYKYFNQHDNPFFNRNNYSSYIENLMKTCKSPDEMNTRIDEEINHYVNYWWDNENVHNEYASGQIREKLTENARREIVAKLRLEYSAVQLKIRKERNCQINGMRIKIREFLNSSLYLKVTVEGEQSEINNLKVRIKVKEDPDKWKGKTNEAGFWQFTCTKLGYMTYEFPDIVELEYDGKILTQPLKYNSRSSANIIFKLPTKEKKEKGECEPPVGTYKGKIHQEIADHPYSGPIEIVVTDKDNIKLNASYTAKWSSEYADFTQEVKIECKGKMQYRDNECIIYFEGKQMHKFITLSKHPSEKSGTKTQESTWLTYAKVEGNKLVRTHVKGAQNWEAAKTD